MAVLAPAYLPRRPTDTVLYSLVGEHLESFLAHTREHYERGLPRYVEDELRAYLKCGLFSEGFVRAHCDTCGHDLLIAFSCKSRTTCPSCAGRRMANTAAAVVDRVLPDVPVRQYVLSLPFDVRRLAAFKADVLTALGRIFVETTFASYRAAAKRTGLEDAQAAASAEGTVLSVTLAFRHRLEESVQAANAREKAPLEPKPASGLNWLGAAKVDRDGAVVLVRAPIPQPWLEALAHLDVPGPP